MQSKFLIAAALRYVFCGVIFAIVLSATFNAAAQTTNYSVAEPKAVLLVEWRNPPAASQASHSRPVKRAARIVNVQKFNGADQTKPVLIVKKTEPDKFIECCVSLKPTLLEEQAFLLVNRERSLQNLQSLEWDLEMLYLARKHSENMAQLNFFGHRGRDGKTVTDRLSEIGATDWQAIGENIAFNQGVKNNVEFSVQSWMNSPVHKENILGKNWTRSGIGIAQTSDGKFYITQVFRN